MRLFIAVNFSDEVKDKLYETAKQLKKQSAGGSFSRRENYHLTLCFIGETDRVSDVKRIMDKLSFNAFSLKLCGLGRFSSGEGAIYWIGVKENGELSDIANKLSRGLLSAGFNIDKRRFKPHITLGRRVVMRREFDLEAFGSSLWPISMNISRISLMKSERIEGRLTYTEVYGVSSDRKDAF
ncbi:MAG: RNA 2',3'-cyclic phosphodiesterase [Clostridia bacterium]|nr:RNA 2',3'-cyclic phosphodiesterase [Clostridia bacterium]